MIIARTWVLTAPDTSADQQRGAWADRTGRWSR